MLPRAQQMIIPFAEDGIGLEKDWVMMYPKRRAARRRLDIEEQQMFVRARVHEHVNWDKRFDGGAGRTLFRKARV